VTDETSRRPVALVTGASSGIGAAFAERLAERGHDLIVVARRRDRLEALAARLAEGLGADVRVLVADLTDRDEIGSVERAISVEPELALVVNNAGFSGYRPFIELDPEELERLVEIHCIATARLTRAALPRMVERGSGGIVNIASLLAFSQSVPPDPLPFRTTYVACKAFMVAFTVTLRHELAGAGVRAIVCCPGLVASEFHGANWQGPPQMSPADVVTACLRGLEMDEAICIPGLEDPQAVEDLNAAQRALLGHARSTTLAARYR
jgi:short-subunit dehydrogenase